MEGVKLKFRKRVFTKNYYALVFTLEDRLEYYMTMYHCC